MEDFVHKKVNLKANDEKKSTLLLLKYKTIWYRL